MDQPLLTLRVLFDNPFRIIGVRVEATPKVVEKSFSRARALASIDREIEFDTDIPLAFGPERTMESLQVAKGKIEQLEDRRQHSLWWFWEGSTADEMAFAALRDGDADKAVAVWTRVADGKPVSDSNYSSVRNLGLYYLAESVAAGSVKTRKLLKGFDLLGAFIASQEHFEKYIKLAHGAGKTALDSKKDLQGFGERVARILAEAISRKDISVMNLARYFEAFAATIGKELEAEFIDPLYQEIEQAVRQVLDELKESPEQGLELGRGLLESVEDNLGKLGVLWEDEDAEFKLDTIQVEVARAVLRCSDAHSKQSALENPFPRCLELVSRALEICSSEDAVERLEGHIESLERRIDYGLHPMVFPEVQAIYDEVAPFTPSRIGGIENLDCGGSALQLIEACLPRLKKIYHAEGCLEGAEETKQELTNKVVLPVLFLCDRYLEAGGDASLIRSKISEIGQLRMSRRTREWYRELWKRV